MSDSLPPCGLHPTRFLHLWSFPSKILEWLPFPTLGSLLDTGIEFTSVTFPALACGFFIPMPPG